MGRYAIDIWKITETIGFRVSHYVIQRNTFQYYPDPFMVTAYRRIILWPQEEKSSTLLCVENFNITSETSIPHVCHKMTDILPFSSSLVVTVTPMDEGMYLYSVKSLVNNTSCTFAVGVYDDRILHTIMFPNTYEIIVLTKNAKFYKYKVPQDLVHAKYAELRKNARVLFQAHRTLSGHFASVPVEICLKIIALTDTLPDAEARSIASLYFCRPSCDS